MTRHNAQFGSKHLIVDGVEHLDCRGTLDENVTDILAHWQQTIGKRCVIRLRDVDWVNSSGVRTWALFMRTFVEGRELSFDECSPAIMQQVNLVPSFLPVRSIRSFVVPYACMACQTKEDVLVATPEARSKGAAALTPPLCSKCGLAMECEESLDEYLSFLQYS
jgi:hypothetical protein